MMIPDKVSLSESDVVQSQAENARQTCVLLAEDDPALRRFLEIVLQRAGYHVIPASDGLQALKVVLSTPIDVVITDAMMPNLSGDEFCGFIRNSETLAHLPVILLSGLGQRESNENSKLADAFLSKPVSVESLVTCIDELLARKKSDG